MNTQKRIKTVLTLAAVAILALPIGQVQAKTITVPGGDFQLYKPGTGYTVLATFPTGGNSYAQGVGDGLRVIGDGIANYSDGTSGALVDCPGWIKMNAETGGNDLFNNGVDGGVGFNAFGTWSGGRGGMVVSADSLGKIQGGSTYTLSAVINGGAGPLVLELLAGGVALTPTSSITPPDSGRTAWMVISRTYDAGAIAAYVGQPMTIALGTRAVAPEVYFGTRVVFDNVTLDVVINDPDLPVVDAGIDMISWSGQAVTMDPNVVNNDTQVPQRPLSYAWSAEPPDGVEFSDPAALAPTVTITKATDNPSVVTMTLAVTLPGKDPVTDTMTIDVYDDACLAALDLGLAVIDPTDLDENCITNFVDFALLATTWLDDYTLTEPVAK